MRVIDRVALSFHFVTLVAAMSDVGSDVSMLNDQDLAEVDKQIDEVPFTKVTYEKRGRASMGRDKAKVTQNHYNNSITMESPLQATVSMKGGNPDQKTKEPCSTDAV